MESGAPADSFFAGVKTVMDPTVFSYYGYTARVLWALQLRYHECTSVIEFNVKLAKLTD